MTKRKWTPPSLNSILMVLMVILIAVLIGSYVYNTFIAPRPAETEATVMAIGKAVGEALEEPVGKLTGAIDELQKSQLSAEDIADEVVKAITAEEPTPTPVPPTPMPEVAEQPSAAELEVKHKARLEKLDPTFRDAGYDAWLKRAGFTWDTIDYRTDQIIEETWSERQWASGLPVTVTDLDAPWPTALTTDEDVPNGRCITVGPESQLCTDVIGFDGRATVYVDVQNWSQLSP